MGVAGLVVVLGVRRVVPLNVRMSAWAMRAETWLVSPVLKCGDPGLFNKQKRHFDQALVEAILNDQCKASQVTRFRYYSIAHYQKSVKPSASAFTA